MAVNTTQSVAKGMFTGRVLHNEVACREHWRLVIEVEGFPPAVPGQFVQILCSDPAGDGRGEGAFLRRPFSIGGLRQQGNRSEVLIIQRQVGVGTRWLSHLAPGDQVSLLGPLGNPFTMDATRSRALVVGGGVGLPPMIWLAEYLRQAGKEVTACCGARSADLFPLTRDPAVPVRSGEATMSFTEFAKCGVPVVVSTDDGTLGFKGLIPESIGQFIDSGTIDATSIVAYTCGPERMMRAVAEVCEKREIPCQVCMERMMGCGMGTCQSCVVRTREPKDPEGWRYRLCCTDGPVFDSRDILWD